MTRTAHLQFVNAGDVATPHQSTDCRGGQFPDLWVYACANAKAQSVNSLAGQTTVGGGGGEAGLWD